MQKISAYDFPEESSFLRTVKNFYLSAMKNMDRYIRRLNRMSNSVGGREMDNIVHNGFLVYLSGLEMLNLASSDYLGFSSYPKLVNDFYTQMDVAGLSYGGTSSRMIAGNHEYYRSLEEDLCDLFAREGAIVYSSAYHANTGILPALTTRRDLILADRDVYPGLVSGLRMSEAETLFFRHGDLENLRSILLQRREDFDQVFIVTESIFPLSGDMTDLQMLCDIKREFDTYLYVDESHAIGVRGTNGLGCGEEQACMDDIDFLVASFGMAMASVGAFVVCSDLFHDYLLYTQNSLAYTSALPPINVAWTRFVLNHLSDYFEQRQRLKSLADRLRGVLTDAGYKTGGTSHIVPLYCGTDEESVEVGKYLFDNGFYVIPVCHPDVPTGTSRVRFLLNAAIPDEEYECLYEVISAAGV